MEFNCTLFHMNMDACLPGHVAAEATAATEGGNTRAEEREGGGGGRGGDERRRKSVDHLGEREMVRAG